MYPPPSVLTPYLHGAGVLQKHKGKSPEGARNFLLSFSYVLLFHIKPEDESKLWYMESGLSMAFREPAQKGDDDYYSQEIAMAYSVPHDAPMAEVQGVKVSSEGQNPLPVVTLDVPSFALEIPAEVQGFGWGKPHWQDLLGERTVLSFFLRFMPDDSAHERLEKLKQNQLLFDGYRAAGFDVDQYLGYLDAYFAKQP